MGEAILSSGVSVEQDKRVKNPRTTIFFIICI